MMNIHVVMHRRLKNDCEILLEVKKVFKDKKYASNYISKLENDDIMHETNYNLTHKNKYCFTDEYWLESKKLFGIND